MTVFLVVVSAFLHAAWNALLRLEPGKDRALVAAVGTAALLAVGVAGVRWAAGQVPFETGEALAWAVAAGVLEVLYFTSLARALEAGPLGPVYTISRGGAVLVVWPISIAWMGEVIDATSLAGSGVVMLGLALSGMGLPRRDGDARALVWAVACAVSIAGYHLAYKAALAAGGGPSAVFAVALGVATVINVWRIGEGRRETLAIIRTRTLRVVVMGVVCGGSFLILLEALEGGGAGFVLTLRNTSVLFATGLAWMIGDRPHRAQIVGAVFVAAGATLMAW